MRTTIDIPDALYRKLKGKAENEGCSVKELLLRGVEHELGRRRPRSRRITFPIVPSKRPGTLKLDADKIFRIIPFP